jgi:acetylornithine deacetylase
MDGVAEVDGAVARRLSNAVAARREELIELTVELVRERSLLGEEAGAQRVMAERLTGLGFAVERVAIEPPAGDGDGSWGYAPLDYEGRACVAARLMGTGAGRSLHLSGHVDVVPIDTPEGWGHDPWAGEISDGRIWGRGAGDMKAGLAAYLIGTAAFLEVCGAPAGELLFSSVIEEECTGNGMKAVIEAGYEADGTLIGEPSELRLLHAGVGVIWARLTARGGGAHPAFPSGSSSAEQILLALAALHELEAELNAADGAAASDTVFFDAHERPFRLNIGTLSGGEWPSSEPALSEARVRLGLGRSLTPAAAQELLAGAVRAAAPAVDVNFEGFRAVAYCDPLDHQLAASLRGAHAQLYGSAPPAQVLAATTDARSVSGPCVCYGPVAGAIHGSDEWADIDSIERVASAIALTIASFTGER